MTKKEFCEIMAAGHQEAADNLAGQNVNWSDERKRLIFMAVQENRAMAMAFRDLAKEQPE